MYLSLVYREKKIDDIRVPWSLKNTRKFPHWQCRTKVNVGRRMIPHLTSDKFFKKEKKNSLNL